jgi:hypothetical protein
MIGPLDSEPFVSHIPHIIRTGKDVRQQSTHLSSHLSAFLTSRSWPITFVLRLG